MVAIAQALAPQRSAGPGAAPAAATTWTTTTTDVGSPGLSAGLFVDYDDLPRPHPADDHAALFHDIDVYGCAYQSASEREPVQTCTHCRTQTRHTMTAPAVAADCIIKDALSPAETATLAARVSDQAHAEQEAGYIDQSPDGTRHNVSTLMNKGDEFRALLDHPAAMPVLKHVIGEEMQLSVSNAIIVKPDGPRMPLHTDQWWMPQPQRTARPMRIPVGSVDRGKAHTDDWSSESTDFIAPPVAAQAVFMASDFVRGNGATMVVPGSHLAGRLPRPEESSDHVVATAVPLEAPAGSCVVYDARLWHGTGVNDGSAVDTTSGLPWRLGAYASAAKYLAVR